MKQIAVSNLSRRSEDEIHCYLDDRVFIAYFNNGAFANDQTIVDDGTTVSCVSGNPLIAESQDSSRDVFESLLAVRSALATSSEALQLSAGSFVAVSWDKRELKLKLCADKLAQRPLYIFLDPNLCVFATNLRTLRCLIYERLTIDEQGLGELIYLGQCLGSRTVNQNVTVLRPAEILTVMAADIISERYFSWDSIASREYTEAEACELLYDSFIRAIRMRSRSDVENAFLSGGMDSRCVVAGLVDIGRKVRSFGSSFPGSANDVISRLVANAFGTEHVAHYRSPAERLKTTMIPWGVVARKEFFAHSEPFGGRVMFGGHGGSVGLGHVYMDARNVRLAMRSVTDDIAREIFPQLKKRATRLLDCKRMERFRQLTLESVKDELNAIEPRRSERRLYLYYLLNDQMRHSYQQYEDIDLSAVEIENPFLDPNFLSIVVAAPIDMFLQHHLYNRWLTLFHVPAASIPWQVYPGHEPGAMPMPDGIQSQWNSDWYRGREVRDFYRKLASRILKSKDLNVRKYISSHALRGLKFLNLFGIERYNYELSLGGTLYRAISGEAFD